MCVWGAEDFRASGRPMSPLHPMPRLHLASAIQAALEWLPRPFLLCTEIQRRVAPTHCSRTWSRSQQPGPILARRKGGRPLSVPSGSPVSGCESPSMYCCGGCRSRSTILRARPLRLAAACEGNSRQRECRGPASRTSRPVSRSDPRRSGQSSYCMRRPSSLDGHEVPVLRFVSCDLFS